MHLQSKALTQRMSPASHTSTEQHLHTNDRKKERKNEQAGTNTKNKPTLMELNQDKLFYFFFPKAKVQFGGNWREEKGVGSISAILLYLIDWLMGGIKLIFWGRQCRHISFSLVLSWGGIECKVARCLKHPFSCFTWPHKGIQSRYKYVVYYLKFWLCSNLLAVCNR